MTNGDLGCSNVALVVFTGPGEAAGFADELEGAGVGLAAGGGADSSDVAVPGVSVVEVGLTV